MEPHPYHLSPCSLDLLTCIPPCLPYMGAQTPPANAPFFPSFPCPFQVPLRSWSSACSSLRRGWWQSNDCDRRSSRSECGANALDRGSQGRCSVAILVWMEPNDVPLGAGANAWDNGWQGRGSVGSFRTPCIGRGLIGHYFL